MTSNISIQVNGEFLDLEDATVRLEISNPFFETEIYQGDYSFPFEVPTTEKNLKILGFGNLLDVSNRILSFEAYLHLCGLPYAKNKLIVTRGRKHSISLILTGGIKSLRSADMKLADIPLGEDFSLGYDQAEIVSNATYAGKVGDWKIYGFTFVPFYQPDFYGDSNPDFQGIINITNSATGDIVVSNSAINGNPHTLVPFLFLFHILNQIFKFEGLIPSGSAWDDTEYQSILVSNNRSLDGGLDDSSTKVILTAQTDNSFRLAGDRVFFQLGPAGSYDYSSAWYNSGITGSFYEIKQIGTHFFDCELDMKTLLPGPGLAVFAIEVDGNETGRCEFSLDVTVNEIQKGYLSCSFTAAPGDIGKTACMVFYNVNPATPSIDYAELMPGSFMTVTIDKKINKLDGQIVFKNHVADMTVGELLAEIKKFGINFKFDFQNASVKLDTVKSLLDRNNFVNWQEKAEPDYDMNVEDSGKGITIAYEFPSEEIVNIDLDPQKFLGEFLPWAYLPNPARINDWVIIANTNEIQAVVRNLSGDLEWKKAGYNYKPYVIGNGELDLKLKIAPAQMTMAYNILGSPEQNLALMPYITAKGTSTFFATGTNPTPFRIMFWRGSNRLRTPPNLGGNYILANTGNYCANDDTIGQRSFRLDKSNGVVRDNTDKLYNAINEGCVVEKNITLDPLDVHALEPFFKVNLDYNAWLFKSISLAVSRMIIQAKVYLLKL